MNTKNNLLLQALKLNTLFSGLSALLMIVTGNWVAEQFSLDSAILIYIVSGCLTVFALLLGNIVRTKNIRTAEIVTIIIADIIWVIASIILIVLFYTKITPIALILVSLVAVIVFVFAVMQIQGFKQYRKVKD